VGSLSFDANGGRQVNGLCYKVWQIVYVVHAFALTFIPDRADDIVHALSTSLTLEPCIIQFAITRTIRSERNEPVDIVLEETKRVEWEDFKSQVSSSRVEKRKRTEIEHQRALLEKQKYVAAERKKAYTQSFQTSREAKSRRKKGRFLGGPRKRKLKRRAVITQSPIDLFPDASRCKFSIVTLDLVV
jgi:hypothetical protein